MFMFSAPPFSYNTYSFTEPIRHWAVGLENLLYPTSIAVNKSEQRKGKGFLGLETKGTEPSLLITNIFDVCLIMYGKQHK